MPRRRVVAKREILPDPLYNSQLVTKFINSVMGEGKKSVAEGILYGALNRVAKRRDHVGARHSPRPSRAQCSPFR